MIFKCQLFTAWCISVEVLEINRLFPNTAVVTSGPKCLDQRGLITLNTNGEISGDGWFDNRFEFMGEVTHNCTRNGKKMMFYEPLNFYPDHLEEIKAKFNIEIAEKGREK